MWKLHTFLRRSRTDRRTLVEAVFVVAAVRLGLWVLPFRLWRPLLAMKPAGVDQRGYNHEVAHRVTWAVTTVSRYVPAATCLTQALAARVLLSRYGCPSQVRISVAYMAEDALAAHAWVESDERVVIGGPAAVLARYRVLPLPHRRQ
jgi:hypothetical protein